MRVCDKCADATRATAEVVVTAEDERFDLCDRHMQVLYEFLRDKEKLTLFGRKQKIA